MKIFFYVNVLGGGGAERVVANLANQFARNGDEVSVITSYAISTEYVLDDAVGRFQLEEKPSSWNRIVKNYSRVKNLRRIVKKEKPDVLISFMAEPNYRAVLATLGLPTKTIISVRNDPDKEYPGRIARFLARRLLPLASGCVFQTDQAQKWFPQQLREKSQIIFNAVNPIFYDVLREPQDGLIVTCGRLNKQKNHFMLIKAIALVLKAHPDVKLEIYGSGPLKSDLDSLIKQYGVGDKIELCGTTSNVPAVLSSANVFVLSSDYEGMPNALMEAMASGAPCISTDCPCGGPKMLIENGKDGILVPLNDEKALADALCYILDDSKRAEQMGKAAKKKAMTFAPDIIFQQWREYVYSIAREDRGRRNA